MCGRPLDPLELALLLKPTGDPTSPDGDGAPPVDKTADEGNDDDQEP
jgi:hypothetical protein